MIYRGGANESVHVRLAERPPQLATALASMEALLVKDRWVPRIPTVSMQSLLLQ